MTIQIRQEPSTYVMVDGSFKCQHENLSVDDNGVYCWGCNNTDMYIGETWELWDSWKEQSNLGFDESDCNE